MKTYCVLLLALLLVGLCSKSTAAQTPDFQADFASADCNSLKGVAYDNNNLVTLVTVDFFENSTLIGSVVSNRPATGPFAPIGSHAFEFPIPGTLKDGQLHTISARMEPVGTDMADSPRTIGPCSPSGFAIPNPKITSFEIRDRTRGTVAGIDTNITTNANVNLRVEIDQPDRVHFYRLGEITCPNSVSDRPEDRMKNLPWQPYTQGQSFTFRLNTSIAQPYGTRCIFMEVNRTENESSASAAKGDSIVLAPHLIKTFTLTTAALKDFIDRAKALGYKFPITGRSLTGSDPCPPGLVIKESVSPQGTGGLDAANGVNGDVQTTSAKLFDRNERFLNPFWKMTAITVSAGNGQSVSIAGPPSGRQDDPFRTVGIKQSVSISPGSPGFLGLTPQNAGSVTCVAPTPDFDTSRIASITLEGPDDEQPSAAFFDPSKPVFRIISTPNLQVVPRPNQIIKP